MKMSKCPGLSVVVVYGKEGLALAVVLFISPLNIYMYKYMVSSRHNWSKLCLLLFGISNAIYPLTLLILTNSFQN